MFNIFKKNKESVLEPETIVVAVPEAPVTCVQPSEHSILAKIRELQIEKDQINQFLETPIESVDTKELTDLSFRLASETQNDYCVYNRAVWYNMENAKSMLAELYMKVLPDVLSKSNFSNLQAEVNSISSVQKTVEDNKSRLEKINKELKALKASLGVE